MKQKVSLVFLSLFMIVSSLFQGTTVLATTEESSKGYEIYPTPQEVTYNQGDYIIRPDVNAIVEEEIDSATINRLDEILKSKNKNVTKVPSKQEGKTNIYLGIYGSNGVVDQYVINNYKFDTNIFTKEGSYFLGSNNDEIVILGKNSDAVFYGLTTLKLIFNQMDGSTIRNFEIKDYADTKIRGFIEGYYGIPWSNEERMELMKFGGDFKMTSYIFAPKNDPYHKELWREEYPANELAKLKEMVAVGNATKCRFVWTAHPFMGGFNRNEYKKEIQALIAKFEHLYNDAGVRQFGVLGDDVGGLPRSIVVEMMQEVSKWAQSKGDVYDTVFCPGGYNHSWQGDYSELNEYDAGFPKDIQIFWTGEAVCQPIEQRTLDHFRSHNKTDGTKRRAPLFWLNWPVNDINHSRMIMGHGTKMLQTNIHVEDLAGAVTNPMQESEPSKVAIFQLADYSWNVENFNGKKSWEASFEYIDPNAAEELYTLAKHMSNPEPNGHWLVMPESEELAPKLAAFKQELEKDKVDITLANDLIREFEIIVDACDGLHAKSKNEELKKDLAPFTSSLKDLAEANINYIKAKLALDEGNQLEAFNLYTAGQNKYKASASHKKPMLGGGTEIVDPGSTHLIPFAKEMEKRLSAPMNQFIAGGEDKVLKISASSNYTSWTSGTINNIIDGKDNTHAWHDNTPRTGDYFQVNFNIPQTIYGVHILNGAAQQGKDHDTFESGKVMYQTKDQTWHNLGKDVYNQHPTRIDISSIEVKDVVAVRYECVNAGSNWPAMREFRVSTQPENGTQFTKEVIHIPNVWSIPENDKNRVIDGDTNAYAHFKTRHDTKYRDNKDHILKDDWIGLKLSTAITLGKIDILQGKDDNDTNDYIKKATLQYSENGTDWKNIEGLAVFENQKHIMVDLSDKNIKAQYVRLKVEEKQHAWIAIREFDVKEKRYYNAKAYTNVETLKEHKANVFTDQANLAPKENITLEKDQYIGLKLDRIHEITEIKKVLENDGNLKLQISQNSIEWNDYTTGTVNARYVRLVNPTDNSITFNLKELSLTSREVYPKKFLDRDSNFSIYDAAQNPASNLFDGDWTTQVIFQASQHQGNKFIYDLGQEIDIQKLKVVSRDSEHDFPRHAKIEVSTDKTQWHTIMTLGNQDQDNPGEAQNKDEIGFVLPNHETSYNTKEVVMNSKTTARYIKFEITRNKSGSDKWVRFQEFIINDGAYIPTVNDPTFESDVMDTLNGKYEYLTDQDLSTAYIPAKDSGKLTYHISDNNHVNSIKLVQALSPISNAVVKARIAGNNEVITLGTLSQTVNEFILPDNTVLLDVVIEWNGVTPILNEMILSKTNYVKANKDKLNQLLAESVDTSNWTLDSKTAYQTAIEAGKKVKDSLHINQATVDSAVATIETAKAKHQVKGDMTLLEEAASAINNDKNYYTAKSWRAYNNVLNAIKKAQENAENVSDKDVEKLLADLTIAKKALIYNPSNMEESILTVQAENDFIVAVEKSDLIYTVHSWEAYKQSKEAIEALLMQNRRTEAHPAEYEKALNSLKASKNALVNISELKELMKGYDATDKSIYSKESFSKYEKAINDSKPLLVNGTKENVANAVSEINNAKKGLQLVVTVNTLESLIKEAEGIERSDYTKASYDALNNTLKEIKNKKLNELSDAELKVEINKLQTANNNLVSVKALKESLKVVQGLDKNLYTSSSYKNLEKLIADSQTLFNNGTKEEIGTQILKIDQTIKDLVLRANENDVKEYLKSIQLVDGSLYTKESYATYLSAYNILSKLASNLDDVSVQAYLEAKEKFETAQANLVKQSQDAGKTPATGVSTNTAFMWVILVGAGTVLVLKLKNRNIDMK